jgi:hypothetical protein
MSNDDSNPYAPSQHVGRAAPSSLGKTIAVICLVVAAVLSIPIAFFVSCIGGLVTVSSVAQGPPADGLMAFAGFGCGFVGVGLTIWGFAKLIAVIVRSDGPAMPYAKPRDFANAPPFTSPDENPFADRGSQ